MSVYRPALALALFSLLLIGRPFVVLAAVVHVELNVNVLHFNTTGAPVAFWTRAYDGRLPGPIIRVKQGDTLHITLRNKLGPDSNGPLNWFRLPNTTNLHLHGMHLSPAEDDVFRHVGSGNTSEYVYEIPKDHSPGTYFYHPHVHGSSSNQQGGGMAGVIIVEATDTASWPAALVAMKEEILLLQHLCFRNYGKYKSSTPYINHLEVVKWGLDDLNPDPTYLDPNVIPDFYLANGIFRPNITMSPGELRRFRIVGAGTSAFLELQVLGKFASSCEMWVLAKDGVWVGNTPYLEQYPLLVPGGRIDLAVRCNRSGYYSFESHPNAPYHSQLAKTTVVFSGPLFGIHVGGNTISMSIPGKLPPRPDYLPDLMDPSTVNAHSSNFSLVFETIGGPFSYGPPYPVMHINGESFSDKDHFIHEMKIGGLEEWNVGIAGDSDVGAGNHPFHMHVNPFQVVAIGSGGSTSALGVRVGEYRDTIPMSQSLGSIRIRFIPGNYTGRALVHCHMVPHIDLGMAAVTKISAKAGNASR